MPSARAAFVLLAACFGVSGCGVYDPPVQGDHHSPQYLADLEKCRADSRESVRRKNAGTPGTWILSPFTGPPEVRAAIRSCMSGKGYVLEKAAG
jgi:hypothetical protein